MSISVHEASSREVVIKVSAHYGVVAGALLIAFGLLILDHLPVGTDPLKLWVGKFAVAAGVFRLAISRYGTIRLNLDENVVEFRLRWLCGLRKKLKWRLSDIVDVKIEISHYSNSIGISPRRVSLVKEAGDVLPLTSYFDGGQKNHASVVDAIQDVLRAVDQKRKRLRASRDL